MINYDMLRLLWIEHVCSIYPVTGKLFPVKIYHQSLPENLYINFTLKEGK